MGQYALGGLSDIGREHGRGAGWSGHRARVFAVAEAGQWTWDGTDDGGRAVPSGPALLARSVNPA